MNSPEYSRQVHQLKVTGRLSGTFELFDASNPGKIGIIKSGYRVFELQEGIQFKPASPRHIFEIRTQELVDKKT